MSKIKIIADSGCDISLSVAKEMDIKIIPIHVNIDTKTYLDGVDITNREFYQIIRNSKVAVSTSQITPSTFEREFTQVLQENEKAIYISFSSGLSGIYQSSLIAKQALEKGDNITIIDSKCASGGYGMVVLKAAQMAASGKSMEEIIAVTNEMCNRMEHIFAAGSLEMLRRGGRITGGQAFIANALNIKPMLHVVNGKIYPLDKVRGTKKMLSFMVDKLAERGKNITEQTIGISHADNPQLANELAALVRERFKVKEIIFTEIGAAIGSHSGPDTLALFFQH